MAVDHEFVPDKSASLTRGLPLSTEYFGSELTLPSFIREVTVRYPTCEALVHRQPDGRMERWSYSDLWERSMDVAKALVASGLGKGERVGILMTNRAEFLTAVFGTALAGGVAAPLSTFSTPDELGYLVATAACSILLLERHILKKDFADILCVLEPAIGSAAPGILASTRFPFLRHLAAVDSKLCSGAIKSWHSFLGRGVGVLDEHVAARARTVMPADVAMLFFSSGSTGKPKGILSAHRGVVIQLWRMRRMLALGDGVRSWTANGFFWSGNFAMVLGATLAAGGSLVLQRIFVAEETLELIESQGVSFLFAWPHQWAQLRAAANWAKADLSTLIYIDGETPIAQHATVRTLWIEPRHCYGNTETFTLSTGYPANTSRIDACGSYGPALPGNSLKIVDPLTGRTVPIGQRGEIAVKGPTLMIGYLGVPADQTLDDEGYFATGDGGYLDVSGRLFWEGRMTDIIKTGGANVSPVEVDEVVREFPGVKVAQTVGVPHETLGELVVTCVVAHAGRVLDEVNVRNFAKEKLASYKVPRRVLFFAESDLQMTGSAKVKTGNLRDLVVKALERTPASSV